MTQSPAGKFALLAFGALAVGGISVKLALPLAGALAYTGWSGLLPTTAGIVTATAVPWVLACANRGPARWPAWLLACYVMAVAGGMRYFLTVRFLVAPRTAPAVAPAPSPLLALEIAGLAAVAYTFAVITLVLVAAMAEVVAPGPAGGRIHAWYEHREIAQRHTGPVEDQIPARRRVRAPGRASAGRWVRGTISVRDGSVLWEPGTFARTAPAELATGTIVDGDGLSVTVDSPSGSVQLECDAWTFALLQHGATQLARPSRPQTADDRI